MGDRHRFRAEWHDYNGGIYFVTICTADKRQLFGTIREDVLAPTQLGRLVEEQITALPTHYPDVELWNHVVMPNHIHIVLAVGTRLIASASSGSKSKLGCLNPPKHGAPAPDNHHNCRLATIIGAFKAGVTRIARTRLIASQPVWQSRYHEHIIRTQRAYDNIMNYIDHNPANWLQDCFH